MKFVCSKNEMLEAINTVQKAVMLKATLPILEGIYIEANDNVKFIGNNFDLGIEFSIKADVMKTGSIVLNSKLLGDIIRKLPDFDVFFEVKEDSNLVVIECGNVYFEIKGLSAEGYPMLMDVNNENKISILEASLRDMIRKTIYAISFDDNRKILTGSLFYLEDGEFSVVALDGFRLAISKNLVKENVTVSAIIPGKNLNEIHKILDNSNEEINITLGKNQALIEVGSCRIISKLIDGIFMNYKNFIPDKFETKIIVNTKDIIESIERASLITSDNKKYPVKFIINEDILKITSNAEVGISKEEIEINMDGNNLEIGFNPRYLLDSLKPIEDEKIVMSFSSAIGPAIITPENGEKFLFMILPVRMN